MTAEVQESQFEVETITECTEISPGIYVTPNTRDLIWKTNPLQWNFQIDNETTHFIEQDIALVIRDLSGQFGEIIAFSPSFIRSMFFKSIKDHTLRENDFSTTEDKFYKNCPLLDPEKIREAYEMYTISAIKLRERTRKLLKKTLPNTHLPETILDVAVDKGGRFFAEALSSLVINGYLKPVIFGTTLLLEPTEKMVLRKAA